MTRTIISTDLGDIEADLFTDGAPKAAQNFIDLANKGLWSLELTRTSVAIVSTSSY